MVRKSNKISLIVQEGTLKSVFPDSTVKRYKEESLVWTYSVRPSPLSDSYTLKLQYKRNEVIKVFVIEPKPLVLAKGKTKLPHVYSTNEQRLCLYYPTYSEWNVGMLYIKTLIPWACEWLLHYECWVITGEWHGGGIHDEHDVEKQENK